MWEWNIYRLKQMHSSWRHSFRRVDLFSFYVICNWLKARFARAEKWDSSLPGTVSMADLSGSHIMTHVGFHKRGSVCDHLDYSKIYLAVGATMFTSAQFCKTQQPCSAISNGLIVHSMHHLNNHDDTTAISSSTKRTCHICAVSSAS